MKVLPGRYLLLSLIITCGCCQALEKAVDKEQKSIKESTSPKEAIDQSNSMLPVTVMVVDTKTKKPITDFAYNYWTKTEKENLKRFEDEWFDVQSQTGTFKIDAPLSCEIHIAVRSRDYIDGYGYPLYESHVIKAGDKNRRITIRLTPGVTVSGIVRNGQTKEPISNATISPIIFTPPLFVPDELRTAMTDDEGRFELRGIDPDLGIHVNHPDYIEREVYFYEETSVIHKDGYVTINIELKECANIRGVVRDWAGHPLEGVRVEYYGGEAVLTAKDGTFVVKCAVSDEQSNEYYLDFEKDGYINKELSLKQISPARFSITLKPCPILSGQVFDKGGKLLRAYSVFTGPGKEPRTWECSSKTINDTSGRFSLKVEKEGEVWIGIRAQDHAMWERCLDTRSITGPLKIHLAPGASVTGKIIAPKGRTGEISATLTPEVLDVEPYDHHGDLSQRQILGTVETIGGRDGALHFHHVQPGRYMLYVSGDTIAPISCWVRVPDKAIDLGALLVHGTGSVYGQVHKPKSWGGGAWAFADGWIRFPDMPEQAPLSKISFKTDENGRFRVDNVPVGVVKVGITYPYTADIINSHTRVANVKAGKATEVRFFDPNGEWDVKCHVKVGDGSDSHFVFGSVMNNKRLVKDWTVSDPQIVFILTPLSDDLVSFPDAEQRRLSQNMHTVIEDVHPGRYRLSAKWHFEGPWYEQEIWVKSHMETVKINLSSGSITGKVEWIGENQYHIALFAVDAKGQKAVRKSFADRDGNFCFRYLSPGDYIIYAHDFQAGWYHTPTVTITDQSDDIGVLTLGQGATVFGKVAFASGKQKPDALYAIYSNGISRQISYFKARDGKEFAVGNLWPGKWTITLQKGAKILAEKKTNLKGNEKARVDLVMK